MAKRFNFTYELSFDEKVNWTDITGFVDSRQTQIEKPAMSGEFKSSVGTCSFQVSYKKGIGDQMERHAALFASLVEAKMSNSRVWFHLLRNNNAIFTGTVDLSGLSQDVSNRPEWIQLTAYNNIRLLDENMKTAFEFCPDPFLYRDKDGNEVVYHSDDGKWYYKNSTIEYKGTRYPMFKLNTLWPVFKCNASDVSDDIVVQILLSQGWELSDINFAASEPILTSDGQSLRRSFAPYDPGKSERTARNYLDSLLHDNLAYLTTDGDGRFVVKRYKMTESKLSNIKGIARYLKNSRKLNIGGAIWNKDGIKLTWASLSAMKAKVYDASFSASISYGTDADGNETNELVQGGYDMPGHTYWPETGDLEEVWFDFSSDWLDRQYLCHITSKRNEDMMLMSTKNLDIDAQREPDIVLAELDGGASDNPTIMPLRMRTLFYNNSSAAKKFTRYKVYADCLYRAKVNTMVCPEMSEDYDEYTSEFIFSEENASEYARGMYNLRHYGSMVYKWVQKEEVNPGDIWVVSPKDTNISTKVFVTNVTITFENGETWYTVDALGVSAYNSEPLAKKSISVGATEASKGDKGDSSIWKHGTALWGESTARGVAGNVDDYYLNDETMNLYRCITPGNTSSAVWQYVGCIKGNDATFNGTTFVIEYALSSSDESIVFEGVFGNSSGAYGKTGSVYGFQNNIWAETIQDWYRGLYVWTRIKTTDRDGNITYGEPTYAEEITRGLEQSCIFEVVPSFGAWEKDLASDTNVTVGFSLKMTGFPSVAVAAASILSISIQPYRGGVEIGSAIPITVSLSSLDYTFTFAKSNDWDSMVITATMRVDSNHPIETASATVTANDVTGYVRFVGVMTTNALPTRRLDNGLLVQGDYFVAGVDINSDGIGTSTVYGPTGTVVSSIAKGSPLRYLGSSSWEIVGEMTDYNMAMGCLGGILDAGIEVNSMYYTWIKNLVTQNAVIDNLMTRMLTVGLGNETTGFYVKIAEERNGNTPVYTCVIKYNGVDVFSVDPVNGKVKMINANVTGDFTSEGFATQNASETHSVSASCLSPNTYDIIDFFCAACGSLLDHTTYIQTSSSPYSRTFYSNTGGYFRGTAFSKIGVLSDPRFTYLLDYNRTHPFSGPDRFTQVWLVSGNDGTCIVFVDQYWGGGDVSANVKSVAGIIFGSGATASFNATQLGVQGYVSTSITSSVVYSGTTAWSSNSNADIYHYDIASISMDSSYNTFTGTVTINGSIVISTSSPNQYYIKKVDDSLVIANSSYVVLYTIRDYNSQSWSLGLSVAAGLAGVKIQNALPMSSGSKLGTAALPFDDVRSNNGTIGSLTATTQSLGSDFCDGACGWTYLPNGLLLAWGEANITKGGVDTIYFNTAIPRFPGFTNIPGIAIGYETSNRDNPLVITEFSKDYFKTSNQAGSGGSTYIYVTFIAIGRG